MDLVLCFLVTFGGCFLFYLSSPNQQLRAKALSQRPWRMFAWILLLLAFPLWMNRLDGKAGFFAALVLIMLLLGSIPLLSLLGERKELADDCD